MRSMQYFVYIKIYIERFGARKYNEVNKIEYPLRFMIIGKLYLSQITKNTKNLFYLISCFLLIETEAGYSWNWFHSSRLTLSLFFLISTNIMSKSYCFKIVRLQNNTAIPVTSRVASSATNVINILPLVDVKCLCAIFKPREVT